MTPFLAVGLSFVCGLLVAKIANVMKLPAVTGYLVAGMIIGPSIASIVPARIVSSLGFIESLALAFIAFGIGKEFQWENLKRVGPGIVTITVVQGLAAVIFRQSFPEFAGVVTTVILGSVMVYELLGPVMARIAIFKAGEAYRLSGNKG